MSKYPSGFLQHKILPEMLKSFEFGGGSNKVFSIILSISEKLPDDDFEKDIQPVIVRMFMSQERPIRMSLLENLNRVIDRLSAKVVNDKIFPNLVTGFIDVVPVIREQTVRAVLVVIPKVPH
jgi:SCY1-like protein 1